ncbi:hypothetical protein [Spirosoma endbachense]|uniref:Bacteriocin n=1 Tax=Spirosoma endbachense TaxID=2666025 RepID=A0A6P1VQP9_9BACT|nr:hypothetical protein [Spirosoma endbachense]QHV94037.1 hypothetical protein GJR95_02900 [Spirosoma endbachense]
MKKQISMASFSGSVLNRAQLREIKGGMIAVSCTCSGGASWSGIVYSNSDLAFFNKVYCGGANKGTCNP